MDVGDYPSLGRLAVLNAQLLADNLAVVAVAETQLDELERLRRAVLGRDWEAVLRMTEQLAGAAQDCTDKAIARSARKVRDALRRDPTGRKATQPLGELLAACREAKLRRD